MLRVRVLAWFVSAFVGTAAAANGGEAPLAQITVPTDGFKLRLQRSVAVRARVGAGEAPLREWVLELADAQGGTSELARGKEPLSDDIVTELAGSLLVPGATYTLMLRAWSTDDQLASAHSTIRVPDPQYTLIPLEPRNLAAHGEISLALDASGMISVIAGRLGDPSELILRSSAAGTVRRLYVPLSASLGLALSGDGQRLHYFGRFRHADGTGSLGLAQLPQLEGSNLGLSGT